MKSAYLMLVYLFVAATTYAHASAPKPPHADIWIRVVDGAIVTGAISEGMPGVPGLPVSEDEQVFGAEFGEDPKFPFATTEPGVQSLPSRETAGAIFSMDLTGPLLAWNGDGVEPTLATVTIAFGPFSVTSGEGPQMGFDFSADSRGLLHVHFSTFLNGDGSSEPLPGVYLLPLVFSGVTPPYVSSKPDWIVWNLGASEASHDAAITYARLYLACAVDISGDGLVDTVDLDALINAWGTTDASADCNGDGAVDGADLGALLGAWGHLCM